MEAVKHSGESSISLFLNIHGCLRSCRAKSPLWTRIFFFFFEQQFSLSVLPWQQDLEGLPVSSEMEAGVPLRRAY